MKNGTLTYRVAQLEKTADDLVVKVDAIRTNELPHIQATVSKMRTDLAVVKTNVSWLQRWFWVVATASVGGAIASVINLTR